MKADSCLRGLFSNCSPGLFTRIVLADCSIVVMNSDRDNWIELWILGGHLGHSHEVDEELLSLCEQFAVNLQIELSIERNRTFKSNEIEVKRIVPTESSSDQEHCPGFERLERSSSTSPNLPVSL